MLSATVVFSLSWVAENIGLLELPLWIELSLSGCLGEITKWWNSKMNIAGRGFFGGRK